MDLAIWSAVRPFVSPAAKKSKELVGESKGAEKTLPCARTAQFPRKPCLVQACRGTTERAGFR
jgi:hypothetical protein